MAKLRIPLPAVLPAFFRATAAPDSAPNAICAKTPCTPELVDGGRADAGAVAGPDGAGAGAPVGAPLAGVDDAGAGACCVGGGATGSPLPPSLGGATGVLDILCLYFGGLVFKEPSQVYTLWNVIVLERMPQKIHNCPSCRHRVAVQANQVGQRTGGA